MLFGKEGAYLASLLSIIGHIAPAYYKFKGGKGVIATATTILIIDWQIFLILLALFVIIVAISRYISLGSIVCGLVYPGLVYYKTIYTFIGQPPSVIMLIFPMFVGIMLLFTHRENIKRIMNKKENKFTLRKKDADLKKYMEPDDSLKFTDKK